MGKYKDDLPGGKNPARTNGNLGPGGRYGYRMPDRRAAAAERQKVRNARTPKEQMEVLDRRLGKGKGARKERARLHAAIQNQND